MSQRTRVAIPSLGEGGLESERSEHFGRCDAFTLVDIVDGEVAQVQVLGNPPHVEGGCMRPVGLLQANGVDALIAVGMGPRPFQGFTSAGIRVYSDRVTPLVGDVVKRWIAGEVPAMDGRSTCSHHH